MKRKKIASLLLAGAMAFTMVPGATASADEEVAHIVMEMLYFDSVPTDLQLVEDALNEITIPEIGVEVEFYPLSAAEASSQVSLMISSGQQLDLVVCMSQSDFLSLINKNMLLELDDLYEEYGAGIQEYASDAIAGGYVDSTLYGIPSIEKLGRTYGLITTQEAVDTIGWTKMEDVTLDDMDSFLEQAKEAYPDMTIIQMNGGGNSLAYYEYFFPTDYLGADAACGGILDAGTGDSTEIVNVFATDEYKEYLTHAREWYLNGYINADAATNVDTTQSAVVAGTALGYFLNTELDMVEGQGDSNGIPATALNTSGHYLMQQSLQGQTWVIPYTCEDPEAAMKFLDLTFSNADVANLLGYGIEGVHYVVGEDGGAYWPDGVDAQNNGFHQWFGLYGNLRLRYPWNMSSDFNEERDAYNAELDEEHTSNFLGYTFNPESVKTQYSAVTDVITQYRSALECGSVDPEEVLPQFISALEAAGINEVIAANQESLDAWLAEQ